MYCKCGNKIPEVRINTGYKTCVECSTEEKWGCSQVVYHKTGNTIEVIKDKELCEQINAMAERPAFGVCRGMKGNVKRKVMKNNSQSRIKETKTEEFRPTFNFIGSKAYELYKSQDIETAEKYVQDCLKKNWITKYGANKIMRLIKLINETS